jgi:hypothetical protein
MRDFIINFVESKKGCKFLELYVEAISLGWSYDDLVSETSKLIQEQEIVEVRYYLKDVHGERVGVLFPKGTAIKVTKPIFVD